MVAEGVHGLREQVVDGDDDDEILSSPHGDTAQGNGIQALAYDNLALDDDRMVLLNLEREQHQMGYQGLRDIDDCSQCFPSAL